MSALHSNTVQKMSAQKIRRYCSSTIIDDYQHDTSDIPVNGGKPFYSDGKFKATTLEKEMSTKLGTATTGSCWIPTPEETRKETPAPTFFKAIKIVGPGGFRPDYVDAGLGFNNPTKEVRDEAKELFGGDRRIGGTGHPGASGFQQPKGIEKVLPLELIRVLQHITTDCESVADELAKEYGSDGVYFSRSRAAYRNAETGPKVIKVQEQEKQFILSASPTYHLDLLATGAYNSYRPSARQYSDFFNEARCSMMRRTAAETPVCKRNRAFAARLPEIHRADNDETSLIANDW
ncbi:hypothetical protein DFS33DRAFT_1277875 [Desarmillaria ectypa]|nr:hypothetical protein DFS33DRAFT_1277875 [Desarmillaria ectypa]